MYPRCVAALFSVFILPLAAADLPGQENNHAAANMEEVTPPERAKFSVSPTPEGTLWVDTTITKAHPEGRVILSGEARIALNAVSSGSAEPKGYSKDGTLIRLGCLVMHERVFQALPDRLRTSIHTARLSSGLKTIPTLNDLRHALSLEEIVHVIRVGSTFRSVDKSGKPTLIIIAPTRTTYHSPCSYPHLPSIKAGQIKLIFGCSGQATSPYVLFHAMIHAPDTGASADDGDFCVASASCNEKGIIRFEFWDDTMPPFSLEGAES